MRSAPDLFLLSTFFFFFGDMAEPDRVVVLVIPQVDMTRSTRSTTALSQIGLEPLLSDQLLRSGRHNTKHSFGS